MRIRQSKKGFRCQALADVVLPLTPSQAFDLLTDPEVKQWRQVKVRGVGHSDLDIYFELAGNLSALCL